MSAVIAITDPCVVFALRRESMDFRRLFPFQQRFPGAPCRAQFRGPAPQTVLMLETGLGAAAMETALHWCLHEPRFGDVPYRPRFVLSAGFSGALQPGQRVGDLILASEVVNQAGNCWATTSFTVSRDGQWSASARASLPVAANQNLRFGRLLTVSELVANPREKQRLGERYDALAVDMETAVLARLCSEHGIPLICLRVISDDLHTPLSPHLIELLRRGRVSPRRLAWTVVRHPALIWELWRLARQTRLAACRLSAIGSLLWPTAQIR